MLPKCWCKATLQIQLLNERILFGLTSKYSRMSSLFGGLFAGQKYGFLSDDAFASLLNKPGFGGIGLH